MKFTLTIDIEGTEVEAEAIRDEICGGIEDLRDSGDISRECVWNVSELDETT